MPELLYSASSRSLMSFLFGFFWLHYFFIPKNYTRIRSMVSIPSWWWYLSLLLHTCHVFSKKIMQYKKYWVTIIIISMSLLNKSVKRKQKHSLVLQARQYVSTPITRKAYSLRDGTWRGLLKKGLGDVP